MRKIIYLILIITLSCSCVSKQKKVEKFMEDGVEVIVNHLEPYKIKGETSNLNIEKVLSIDTEKDEIAETGLTDIYRFDVDSEGSMYFLVPPKGQGNLVYKFDKNGNFITSFARRGQGPYEPEYPHHMRVTNKDEILLVEPPKGKFFLFSKDGTPIKEKTAMKGLDGLITMENGNYLILLLHTHDFEAKYFFYTYNLFNSDFEEIKELDRFSKYPNRHIFEKIKEKYVNGIHYVFIAEKSAGNIYVGNSERGYEILVYDLEGNLLRKIRKEYRPVKVSDEYKRDYMKPFVETDDPFWKTWGEKIYFPEHWYPFHSFFLDDEGRLFIMTYEEGEAPGEYVFDLFNPDGIFIERKSLPVLWGSYAILLAKARMNHLYCVREKESGYKELVVYEMEWE